MTKSEQEAVRRIVREEIAAALMELAEGLGTHEATPDRDDLDRVAALLRRDQDGE